MNFIASEHFRQSLYDYHFLLLFNSLDSINGIDSLVISIKQLSKALSETFCWLIKSKMEKIFHWDFQARKSLKRYSRWPYAWWTRKPIAHYRFNFIDTISARYFYLFTCYCSFALQFMDFLIRKKTKFRGFKTEELSGRRIISWPHYLII